MGTALAPGTAGMKRALFARCADPARSVRAVGSAIINGSRPTQLREPYSSASDALRSPSCRVGGFIQRGRTLVGS